MSQASTPRQPESPSAASEPAPPPAAEPQQQKPPPSPVPSKKPPLPLAPAASATSRNNNPAAAASSSSSNARFRGDSNASNSTSTARFRQLGSPASQIMRVQQQPSSSSTTTTTADDDYNAPSSPTEEAMGRSFHDGPPMLVIDRHDPAIDERAEFLGMDVQDFRELLVLAARRTREQLAVESGEAADHYYPTTSARFGGSDYPPSGANSGGAPSSPSFMPPAVPDEASVAYLSITNNTPSCRTNAATRSDLPSSAGVPTYEQLWTTAAGSTRASTVGPEGTRDSFSSSSAVGIRQPRFPKTRESVASMIRFLGDGMFGRKVMWADEDPYGSDDDDEVIDEYDDDSEAEKGSSINSRFDDDSSGEGGSGLSGGPGSRLSAGGGGMRRKKIKKAQKQPLYKVSTYELHGTMLMGVQRVGQWRGWLWLLSYFLYHMLIEYSAAYVGKNDEQHGRQVLRARAWGAVFALLIALSFVGIARCIKTRSVSRSRTAWSMGTNGIIIMSACGTLLGAFEAFFWASLHSKYANGALVVYPTMFIGPVIVVLLRRPFFPSRYHQNVREIPDRVRLAGSGGGTGEGKVVYLTEALSCAIVLIGSVVMCFSFPGNIVDWGGDILLQLMGCCAASVATVCLAVLAQRGLLRHSIIAITICRCIGYFALMLSNEIFIHGDSSSFVVRVPPVLWLSLLMGIDYILFLSATMRSNQHLDIMAVVVAQAATWICVPVLSVLLSNNDYVGDIGVIYPQWVMWLGIIIVLGGCIGLGIFATLRQQFVMYDLWAKNDLFVRPKGLKGQQQQPQAPSAASS